MNPYSPAYPDAFRRFLRRGTPPGLMVKADHPTSHYLWRTTRDGRVRASHAANEGKIFAWNEPPPTGHPGEDYGCRCWAEDYISSTTYPLGLIQTVKPFNDNWYRWSWVDFGFHYRFGNGVLVTLNEIGHLTEVIARAKEIIFPNVESQISEKARQVRNGWFYDTFRNSYDFLPVSRIHGDSTVSGAFQGKVTTEGNILRVEALVDYLFYDEFTDIFSTRERETGTSTTDHATAGEIEETEYGTPFIIAGQWSTEILGNIPVN